MIKLYKNVYLRADERQFIIFDLKISEKGKNKGEPYEVNSKYYPSLEILFKKLFSDLILNELSSENIETFEALETRFLKLSNHVRKISSIIGSTKDLMKKLKSEVVELTD